MDTPSIVLLCGVPGTQLSAIARKLEKGVTEREGTGVGESAEEEIPTTRTWDLENRIRDYYRDRDNGPDSYSMFEVVIKPRQELYQTWTREYNKTLDRIRTNPANVHIVCMHLTWYHSPWKGFYSPVDILSLNNESFPVSHIVVLIDDIYDMFVRLQERNHLYDKATMQPTLNLIGKLSKPPYRPPRPFIDFFRTRLIGDAARRQRDAVEAQRIRIQGVELALGELLAWRRTEMMYAESIARSLNCELTVLGTKHTRASINLLASNPHAPRIYLSHRISEPRRAINSYRSQTNPVPVWSPVAAEVNILHDVLCAKGLVLINPTAIDELRYENSWRTNGRSPRLTRRWPLPEQDLISNPVSSPPDHSEILLGNPPHDDKKSSHVGNPPHDDEISSHVGNPPHDDEISSHVGNPPHDDEISSHVARSLSIQISSDVSFRDHFIVENTPNLCVFRPFHCEPSLQPQSKPEWSGGVTAELNHWMRCNQHQLAEGAQGPLRRRKVAFVHTHAEIKSRLRHVALDDSSNFKENIRNHSPGAAAPALAQDQAGSSALDTSQGTQDVLSDPGGFKISLKNAALIACHFAFTGVLREGPPESSLLVAVKESSGGRVDGMVMINLATQLKDFFDDTLTDSMVGSKNTKFLDQCASMFKEVVGKELLLYALQAVRKDDPRTRNLLGLS